MRMPRLKVCVMVGSGLVAVVLLIGQTWLIGAQASSRPERLRDHVAAITAGKSNADRAAAITKRLEAMELEVTKQSFEKQNRQGTNLLVNLPGPGSRTLMIGAHYDRVAVGEGAVDNAASCAMLLELLAVMRKSPLKNHTLRVAFFDLEELGLLGSRSYIEAARKQGFPDFYINFDIFAYGDALYVLPSKQDEPLARAIRRAGEEKMFPVRLESKYPPSDHLSFMQAGVPTLGVSLLEASEIDGVIDLISGNRRAANGQKRPRIFEIIHTHNDKLDKVDPPAIDRALPVIERTLRIIDTELN